MNISARISKMEKAAAAAGVNSRRILALLRYLQTGKLADIPEDVKFSELQAAARRIPKAAAARSRGFAAIRAALGKEIPVGADVQAFIESNPRPITRAYNVKDNRAEVSDTAADLLCRLGFSIIRINIIDTITPRAGGAGAEDEFQPKN